MDEEEDEMAVVEGVPFIADRTVISAHGDTFTLTIEKGRLRVRGRPLVTARDIPSC